MRIRERYAAVLLFCGFVVLSLAGAAYAQEDPPDDEPEFIVPGRPGITNPAEFQQPGVLQLEIGYNADFHSSDFKVQQDMPLALRFAVNSRLLLELDTDSPFSQTDKMNNTETGAGDTQLGIQAVLQKENKVRPGIALAYYIKIPTASESKGLGTGKFDHSFIGLFSKKFGDTTVDFNAFYLLQGRTSRNGYESSGQGALSVSQEVTKHFGLEAEINGHSRSDMESGEMFALGSVYYKVNKRLTVDGGMRFGLTPDAPRAGVFAGITVGVANLYKKRK